MSLNVKSLSEPVSTLPKLSELSVDLRVGDVETSVVTTILVIFTCPLLVPEECPTFNATELAEGGWKIDISNIKFSKYVGIGTISYRKLGTDGNWSTPITIEKNAKSNQNYSFTVREDGTYEIIIEDAKGKSGTNTQNLSGT